METLPAMDMQRTSDNFSPKTFIIQVRQVSNYILSKWIIILLVGLLLGAVGAGYSYFKKPLYEAELTFALDEEATQTAQNGFVQSGEELGLGPLAIDASGALFGRMTNIAELMRSRLLIERVLRSQVTVHKKQLFFADFFLDSLDYRKKWLKNYNGDHLDFGSKKDTLVQNMIIANIYETLITKNIKVDRKGKETTIISINCSTENESFSKYFLEALVIEVTNYYTDIKTQRAKTNMLFIEKRMDSIQAVYYGALNGKASFTDAHTNPSRQIGIVTSEKQQTELQILKAAYIDLARSLEIAKIAVIRVTPLIQYLDEPLLPLKKTSSSMMKWFLILFVIGSFFTAGFFFIKKIFISIMKQ